MTNVRKHGRGWQVRVTPFPAKTFPTKASAERYRLELLLRRAQGDRYSDAERGLGDEIDAWLVRYHAGGGARDVSIQFYDGARRFGTRSVAPRLRRCDAPR
jgi:hypothetical protein